RQGEDVPLGHGRHAAVRDHDVSGLSRSAGPAQVVAPGVLIHAVELIGGIWSSDEARPCAQTTIKNPHARSGLGQALHVKTIRPIVEGGDTLDPTPARIDT